MANARMRERVSVKETLERIGACSELVPMDPHFHNISVGLYMKDGTGTVWTFSQRPEIGRRIQEIRDQLGILGDMNPIPGSRDQARFSCRHSHLRPLRFLVKQAVEKPPDYTLPAGRIKDLRSQLMLDIGSRSVGGKWVYNVTSEGTAPNEAHRIRAVVTGFTRYGEMEKSEDGTISFPCHHRHDNLAKLILPYARNVNKVEDTLSETSLRGQMTTGTLGFTPPT